MSRIGNLDQAGVGGHVTAAQRITDLEETLRDLQQQNSLLKLFFDHSPDGIIQLAPDGTILSANHCLLELTGYALDALLGAPITKLVPCAGTCRLQSGGEIMLDERRAASCRFDFEKLATNPAERTESFIVCADATLLPVETDFFALGDEQGNVIGAAAIVRDISIRKAGENELIAYRDGLDSLVRERTAELRQINQSYEREILQRETTERRLKIANDQLRERERELKKVNTELLAHQEQLKAAMEQLKETNAQLLERENALLESEQRYRMLVETMSEGLIVMDEDGRITYANSMFCKMLELDEARVIGTAVTDFMDPADREKIEKIFSREGIVDERSYEIVWIGSGGARVPSILSPQPILDAEGEYAGSFGTVTNIAQLKRAEQEMREARDHLENIFRATQDGILVTDAVGTIVRLNMAVERMLGFSTDEIIGKNTLDFISREKGFKSAGINFASKLFEQGFMDPLETYFERKNGQAFPIECNISLLKDEAGGVSGAVAILRDISERKEMERQLIQAEKLSSLGELAGGVAHDFNNVLAAILGRAQLLMSTVADADAWADRDTLAKTVTRGMQIIEKAATDGAETVRRIMGFARKENDENVFAPVDISEVVNDAIEFTRPRWKDKSQAAGITIVLEKHFGSVRLVAGNAAELREVMINVINNAIDAMPQGGLLTVRTFQKGAHVAVEISDNGTGINKTILDKIFDPFFTTKGPQSTGLGMSVSYGIIKRHKGSIIVKSSEGQQTAFTITLPGIAASALLDESRDAEMHSSAARVLVIEDEEDICQLLADILENEGHTVATATNGAAGLEIFNDTAFDVVFTDLAMPGMSGWQVAEQVKRLRPETGVVLVTGWGVHAEKEKPSEQSVDLIVSKPFSVAKVQQALATVMKRR